MTATDIVYVKSVGTPSEHSHIATYVAKQKKRMERSLRGLNHFQKILLVTDGTVTALLEHLSGEPIVIKKLHQSTETSAAGIPENHRTQIGSDEYPALVRKIVLKGEVSATNYIYAESSILLNSLPKEFRDDLVNSNMPIGKLWSKHKFETYKTNFTIQRERADQMLSELLAVPEGSEILSRTYCVYTRGKNSMIITEKFSVSCFSNKNLASMN
tara:strand:- start:742 stop:1383 length:642 start_codon:yes stop_codon:yes gene_type:complete